MKIVMSRTYDVDKTRGLMLVLEGQNKVFECKCIELPDKKNRRKISCIPEGTYWGQRVQSEKFGKSFLLENVPNRDAVMIHIGNFAAGKQVDTLGCILPGMRFKDTNKDGVLDVVESTAAMNKLREILPERFQIIII